MIVVIVVGSLYGNKVMVGFKIICSFLFHFIVEIMLEERNFTLVLSKGL